MAEGENFDDELFADLYENDDEPAQPATSALAGQVQTQNQTSASAPVEVKQQVSEESKSHDIQNGDDSYMQGEDQYEDDDDDDDVDFNIGGAAPAVKPEAEEEDLSLAYSAPPFNQQRAPAPSRGANSKEDGKMFIGGLNWETTDESLRDYFSQFGEVVECTVMRDGATGRSRGFGFLTFKDPKTVNIVMVKEHVLDGKIIDPKRAIPREEQEKTSKIFVGGVSQETTDHEFREYFAQFGRVVDATLMMDKDTGRPRGFGFVTFESEAGVDACLSANLEIHGKPIEVKKAQPRGNLREEEEAARRNGGGKFGRKGPNQNAGGMGNGGMDDGQGAQGGGMAGMQGGVNGGMTPQVMAQYLQRMQQAMAMMQQQMVQSRQPMNPAMMQMMQMQQMQAMQAMMGRGGGNPMANMPPQMMAQMQQMQQKMMNQGGAMAPGGQGPQGANRPAFNAFEQQAFEQQKYDQQHRGGPRNNQQGYGNQGYGGNMGGGGGGPTSWEGMYDDVPQPNFPNQGGAGRGGFNNRRGGGQFQGPQSPGPQDPNHAPPANAPTGPKNAGKPGANYRGGGRGGQGRPGFHPYSR